MTFLLAAVTPWWTNQEAGLIGGGIGILGAVFGCTAGVLAPRLRTPGQFAAMRAFFLVFIGIGLAALAAGIGALAARQPYHVFYPLLLAGLILTFLPASLFFAFRNRQRRIENLRLESESLRRA